MKIELVSSNVKCPYCGHECYIVYSTNDYKTSDVRWCEIEDGGCGKRFVILNSQGITFQSSVYKMSDKAEPELKK